MDAAEASDPKLLAHYEGLVRKTSARYVGIVENMEYEDLLQVFRLKVWRALLSFDPKKSKQGRDSYVFSCVRNQAKDLIRKKRHNEAYIEDVAPSVNGNGAVRDRFELRYLAVEEDEAFPVLAEDDLADLPLPGDLTKGERQLIALSYAGYSDAEIARALGVERRLVKEGMEALRERLADLRPGATQPL